MPRKPHREAFQESTRHLRLRCAATAGVVAVLTLAMEIVVAGESLEAGDLPLAAFVAAVGGGVATVTGLVLGALTRWNILPREICRPGGLVLAGLGLVLALHAITATHASPRNALGMAEDRQYPLLLAGLLLIAFGLANRPPRANLG